MNKFKLTKNNFFIILISCFLVGTVFYIYSTNRAAKFANCIGEKATFYGAYWCPTCALQKQMFKNSFSRINYIECSINEKLPQEKVCGDERISKYPTWIFKDGTRLVGLAKLETLGAKTGCEY